MRELLKAKGCSKAKAAATPASSTKAGSGPAAQSVQEQFRALPKVQFLSFCSCRRSPQRGLHLFLLAGLAPLVSKAAAVVLMCPLSTCSSVFPLVFTPQAEQLGKVERWAVLEGEDLAAALQQYPAAAGGCPLVLPMGSVSNCSSTPAADQT